MNQFLFLLILGGLVGACQRSPAEVFPEEMVLRVSHLRQSCEGEAPHMCYLVQRGRQVGTETWELFYDEIEGFSQEEGFVYTLIVKTEKILNPPMDGSDRRYVLLQVLSKEKATP